jgi:hypothetical protein
MKTLIQLNHSRDGRKNDAYRSGDRASLFLQTQHPKMPSLQQKSD